MIILLRAQPILQIFLLDKGLFTQAISQHKVVAMEQHALKNVNNGKEATVKRVLDGSTYPG